MPSTDNAIEGDIIRAFEGEYRENVLIDKSLVLIGNGAENTTIDGGGSGNVVKINADYVEISKFYITGSGENYAGIIVYKSNIKIFLCNILNNNGYGVYFFGSSKNNNNTILSCNISNNGNYPRGGIHIHDSNNNKISSCNISNNYYYGILLDESNKNKITGCTISNNDGYGIWVDDLSNNNKILICNISHNSNAGIYLLDSSNNTITSCNILNNDDDSIRLFDSNNNTISGCNASNNGDDGIHLSNSKYNIILGCYISNNKDDGIFFWDSSNDNIIFHNNFIDNEENAIDLCSNNWDNGTEGNYWDDYTGEDDDGDGIGETPYDISVGDNKDNFPLVEHFIDTEPPTADAGHNQEVPQGTEVTFDGSNSKDNIGVVYWIWNFAYNETTQTLYGETAKFTFWKVENYKITITLKDGVHFSDIDKMWINVTDITPPKAVTNVDQQVPEGTEVTFDGTNSTDNVKIVNWTWNFTYNETTQTLYGETIKFTFWKVGEFEITLTVKDGVDLSDTDKMWVNVTDIIPPKADAGSDKEVLKGTEFTFEGSNSTDNVGITNWTWTFNDNSIKTLYGVNPKYTFNNVGNFKVTLTVKDSAGLIDTDTMWVNVTEPAKGTITGIVKDEKGKPIKNAVVELINTTFSTKTDENGAYTLKNIPIGTYIILVKKEGHLGTTKNVTVEKGKTINVDIILKKEDALEEDGFNFILIIPIVGIIVVIGIIIFVMYKKNSSIPKTPLTFQQTQFQKQYQPQQSQQMQQPPLQSQPLVNQQFQSIQQPTEKIIQFQQTQICPYCNAQVPIQFKFCNMCGKQIKT